MDRSPAQLQDDNQAMAICKVVNIADLACGAG
jgi:hypothetical protein